ncbi:carbamoyl-phosphate synthase large subunit [Thioalkalivibrio sp. HK1]|uniref:carbamoyl-phosphate synthase large subunit n=1 Tax=Thioalkalivibrio sp. HK1 TaxID=1469245 RepID=UPI00046EE7C5|nr:carbamoyl-phosphate synthase large subunit [Thioalkalivibrio sp. HK1]
MPARDDLESILIIGAGPIMIGQACEFDYSGTQACKALREEGYRVILVNSNPATIMTDPETAHVTYIEPITPKMVRRVIERERPDAILPTMGGQTALNVALDLEREGVLAEYGVELIGARGESIAKAEDRQLFRAAMDRIGLESPLSRVENSLAGAMEALDFVGLPAIIRPSFTLGGTGGGIAWNRAEFEEIVLRGISASPAGEVLIEESLLGWKEYEMEVVRDRVDNCIIVCSIENVDPMGVHTGDSITVAPALTLTDKEYQRMREASIAVLREIGVDTGGSNVQFAVNPADGRQVIIEMNPRVSRSSALASKATGFPIAKVAARLAVGYRLDELDNDITGITPASFEPSIDYVVTKIPRFTFEKFAAADSTLTTSMKSVGEAMSIGGNFIESMQKALRSMEIGLDGFDDRVPEGATGPDDREGILEALANTRPDRLLLVAQAFRAGADLKSIHAVSHYDPWFLERIREMVDVEEEVREKGLPEDRYRLSAIKRMGFSDARLAKLTGLCEDEIAQKRHALEVAPIYRRVDTCAAEFPSRTPYLYGSFELDGECESEPSDRNKIVILGGGPNRIGQGIEFDYCCVHASQSLREAGWETIMVNCNPETVSTDFDTSDRLYFEPLTPEDVIALIKTEQGRGVLAGVIVQFGGQTPLKLAHDLVRAGIPILGTPADAIDRAEDRERFQALLHELKLRQPENAIAHSRESAVEAAERIGYPLVIRPSYVLGGRAMEIVHDEAHLLRYISNAVDVSGSRPVLLDAFLKDAVEIDVDAICDGEDVFVAGVMEHVEEAGVHSGDSACSLPPWSLDDALIVEVEKQARQLALALGVKGLMNVQFAVQAQEIYVLEVNPRASRTVPFVAKATGVPVAAIASQVMAGVPLRSFDLPPGALSERAPKTETTADHRDNDHPVSVKEAVFPFSRFPGVDVLLGPEMRSTGEVMGIDRNFARAFAKSQIAAGNEIPAQGAVFISVRDEDKERAIGLAERLSKMGYDLMATHGTADALRRADLTVQGVNKVHEGRPNSMDIIRNGEVKLVINTTSGARAITDSIGIRQSALAERIPHYTTIAGAEALVLAMEALKAEDLDVVPLQEWFPG